MPQPDCVAAATARRGAGSAGANGTREGGVPPTRARQAQRPSCRIFPALDGWLPVFTGNGVGQ